MTSQTVVLSPKQPFYFGHTLRFLKDFKADGMTKTVEASLLRFALLIQSQPVVVSLEPQAEHLACTLRAKDLSPEVVKETLERVRFYLSLDDDLEPFYQLASKDAAFKPIIDKLYGFHQVKYPTVFSCACWALITQRTPNSFAYKTMTKLTEFLGEQIVFEGQRYTTFPTARAFLTKKASAAILEATNNTRKTERLMAIAEAFAVANENFLQTAPFDEVAKWLKNIYGLGQWSVDYIMHRGLGRMERSPWTDTQIMRVISETYTHGLSISKGDAKKLAETYGWYQGYWVHYLKIAFD